MEEGLGQYQMKWWRFGECPLFFSALQKSQYVFRCFILQSLSHRAQLSTVFNSTRLSYISALVTQEIPIIVDSYLLVQLGTFISRSPRPIDNDTFPTEVNNIALNSDILRQVTFLL